MNIFRKKSIESVIDSNNNNGLQRTLSAFNLFLMGIGAIVGTGIFVLTGVTAAQIAGPAVTLSYCFAGIACIFIALSYTEVASMIPTSGSAYAYTYVAIGEIAAWIVAWMTTLYLVVSASTVASGWSGYVTSVLHTANINFPESLSKGPFEGGLINVPAIFISLTVTFILIRGTKESSALNNILVFVKMFAIFLFIAIAIPHFNIDNWFSHYVDYDKTVMGSNSFSPFGFTGIAAGAGLVFFGYNGFDALASAAEECKNPEKDLTKAILGSLIACIIIYMVVAGLLVAIVPFNELNNSSPLSYALSRVGNNFGSAIVATGAITGMTTVVLVQTYAQSRIVYGISRDGLLPSFFSKIHKKYHTPYIATIVIGLLVAIMSGLVPLQVMGKLASLGALFSFAAVSIVMLVLRKRMPDRRRPFKCPYPYAVACTSLILCGYLMYTLLVDVGQYFMIWFIIGLILYFTYVKKNSVLNVPQS